MSLLEYADAVIEYVQAQGWTANIIELQEGAYIIGGARKTDDASEKVLLMIICEPMTEVESKHLKYLIKTGREENVDAAYVTYTVGITEAAKKIGRSHNISVIPPEKIRSFCEASESDIDTNGSTPDSDSDKQDNLSQDSTPEERGEDSEVQDTEIKEQNRNAGETEKSSTSGEISDDQVDTRDNRSNYSDTEEKNGEANIETKSSPLSKQIATEYSQPEGQVVSGKLNLKDRHLHFKPNDFDELLCGDEIEIPYCQMADVDTKNRLSGDIKDILFRGGFQKQLKIETQNGHKFLFVVSNATDVITNIESRIQEVKKTENNIESNKRKNDSSSAQHINNHIRFRTNRRVATALALILMISGGVVLSSGLGNNGADTRINSELTETVDQSATKLLPVVDDFEDGWRGSRYTDGTAIFAAPDGSPVVTYNVTVYNNSDKAQSGLEATNPENIATDGANIGDNGYTYQIENDRYTTVFRDRNVVCSTTQVIDGEISSPESAVVEHAEKCLESIRD